jgi:purine-nucleoside phosphorylase
MIHRAAQLLREKMTVRPRVAVVLGSGLGAFAGELAHRSEVPYAKIPGWPESTAIGHAGKLVGGYIEETPVIVQAGRAHLYEGYTPAQVVFGVRALAEFGVRTFIFTNAAGGVNLAYSRGALVLIRDHINLQGVNPLVGPNDDAVGPRFPDMSDAYSVQLREIAKVVAGRLNLPIEEGVYAAMLGPTYETPAEIRFLRTIGADLVGMSTVPEIIAANHLGARSLAISCVTNMAAGVLPHKITHAEVLETGELVRARLIEFLKTLVPEIA